MGSNLSISHQGYLGARCRVVLLPSPIESGIELVRQPAVWTHFVQPVVELTEHTHLTALRTLLAPHELVLGRWVEGKTSLVLPEARACFFTLLGVRARDCAALGLLLLTGDDTGGGGAWSRGDSAYPHTGASTRVVAVVPGSLPATFFDSSRGEFYRAPYRRLDDPSAGGLECPACVLDVLRPAPDATWDVRQVLYGILELLVPPIPLACCCFDTGGTGPNGEARSRLFDEVLLREERFLDQEHGALRRALLRRQPRRPEEDIQWQARAWETRQGVNRLLTDGKIMVFYSATGIDEPLFWPYNPGDDVESPYLSQLRTAAGALVTNRMLREVAEEHGLDYREEAIELRNHTTYHFLPVMQPEGVTSAEEDDRGTRGRCGLLFPTGDPIQEFHFVQSSDLVELHMAHDPPAVIVKVREALLRRMMA